MTQCNVEASQEKTPKLNIVVTSEIENFPSPTQYIVNLLDQVKSNKVVRSLFTKLSNFQQKFNFKIEILLTDKGSCFNVLQDKTLQIQFNPRKQSKIQVLRYLFKIDNEYYIKTEQIDCPEVMVLLHEFIHLYHQIKIRAELGYELPYAVLRKIDCNDKYLALKDEYMQSPIQMKLRSKSAPHLQQMKLHPKSAPHLQRLLSKKAMIFQQLQKSGLDKILDNLLGDNKYEALVTDLEELITVFGSGISELTIIQAQFPAQFPKIQHQQQCPLHKKDVFPNNFQQLQFQQSEPPLQIHLTEFNPTATNQAFQNISIFKFEDQQPLPHIQEQCCCCQNQLLQVSQTQVQILPYPRFLYQESDIPVLIKKSLLPNYVYIDNIQLQTLQDFTSIDFSKSIIVTDAPDGEQMKQILEKQQLEKQNAISQERELAQIKKQNTNVENEKKLKTLHDILQKSDNKNQKLSEFLKERNQNILFYSAAIYAVLNLKNITSLSIQDFLNAFADFFKNKRK